MATTANDVFLQAMALADEMTDTVNVVNAADTASYQARTPGILTLLQAELVKPGDLYKTFSVSQKAIPQINGVTSGFTYRTHQEEDVIVEGPGSVRAYSFEVDGEATVLVQDYNGGWNTLATISAPDPAVRSFVTYNGVVTPTPGATRSRLVFSGAYEYTFTNYAMFTAPVKADRVPVYRPWVKIPMPTDFKSLDQVVNLYFDMQYSTDTLYRWENNRELYISYEYEGEIRVNYRPIPSVVATLSSVLELDDSTCRTLMPYGLAAELFKEENELIAKFCRSRYMELKAAAMPRIPANEGIMVDVYGGF